MLEERWEKSRSAIEAGYVRCTAGLGLGQNGVSIYPTCLDTRPGLTSGKHDEMLASAMTDPSGFGKPDFAFKCDVK